MSTNDIFRLGNACLDAMAFLFFAVRINDDWGFMSRGWRITRLSLLGLVFTLGYGSVEVMLADPTVPLGARTLMLPLFLLGLMIGLWLVRRDASPTGGGMMRVDEVRAILAHVEDTHHYAPCENPGCIAGRIALRQKMTEAEHVGS